MLNSAVPAIAQPPSASDVSLSASAVTSAATSERNVGAASAPVAGPDQTRFLACVAKVPVSVPVDVTGEPVTVKIPGSASATLCTVPTEGPPSLILVPVVPSNTTT